jgi:hypothetical protein
MIEVCHEALKTNNKVPSIAQSSTTNLEESVPKNHRNLMSNPTAILETLPKFSRPHSSSTSASVLQAIKLQNFNKFISISTLNLSHFPASTLV